MTEVEWQKLKAHELRALADRDAVVVLPTAACEQHGPHLPVMTDIRLGHEVAVRAARKLAGEVPVVVAPVIWSGLSEHHMAFGGTLSISHATFHALLGDLISAVERHGFRRILIANSHGGNRIAIRYAADAFGRVDGPIIVAASYAEEGAPEMSAILEDQPGTSHADESETSMMLALEPDLVDASDLGSLKGGGPESALGAGRAAYRWRPFTHATHNGVRGIPAKASAEKGELLLAAGSDAIARLIADPATWAPLEDKRAAETGGVPFRDKR